MKIKEDTRRLILEELIESDDLTGQLEVSEFVRKVFPAAETMPSESYRFKNLIDEVRQHMERNSDWSLESLFYQRLKLLEVNDDKFILFLEQCVSPGIKRSRWNEEEQQREVVDNRSYVEAINAYLTGDGYELQENGKIANLQKYKVLPVARGVQGQLKNIIFASQYKPDITFLGALNNEISIENNEDKCLVYDKPIDGTITWEKLKEWYADGDYIISRQTDLVPFMQQSLGSAPEKLFFNAYLALAERYAEKIPALFPQVWLYYDPKLEKDRIKKYMSTKEWIF